MLLQAAILDAPQATASLEQWLAQHDLNQLDESSLRLLPAVDFNLRGHALPAPLGRVIAGLRRHALCRTHWGLRTCAELVGSLQAQGIPCMLLKGAALSRLYAPSPSVRPMNDVDLLVPRRQALKAMEQLRASGFRAHALNPADLVEVRHSSPFSRGSIEIDLHWDVLPESVTLDDAWAFDDSRPLDLGDVTTRALSSTAQLFHTIAHGLRYSETPAAWWPLDAVFVLRGSAKVDFERLLQLAVDHQLANVVYRGLCYLVRHFNVQVPSGVLQRFESTPRSLSVRLEGIFRMHRWEPLGELPLNLLHYRRRTAQLPLGERIRGLPRYLSCTWQLAPGKSFPAAFSKKAAGRLKSWLVLPGLAGARRSAQVDTRHR